MMMICKEAIHVLDIVHFLGLLQKHPVREW